MLASSASAGDQPPVVGVRTLRVLAKTANAPRQHSTGRDRDLSKPYVRHVAVIYDLPKSPTMSSAASGRLASSSLSCGRTYWLARFARCIWSGMASAPR